MGPLRTWDRTDRDGRRYRVALWLAPAPVRPPPGPPPHSHRWRCRAFHGVPFCRCVMREVIE